MQSWNGRSESLSQTGQLENSMFAVRLRYLRLRGACGVSDAGCFAKVLRMVTLGFVISVSVLLKSS
jgi:hypothetical protein